MPKAFPTSLSHLLLLLLLPTLTHCTSLDDNIEKHILDSQTILSERKTSTLSRWKHHHIQQQPPQTYTHHRTSLLLAGDITIQLHNVKSNPNTGTLSANLVALGKNFDFATATAISPHGYYLTASHCIEKQPVFLITTDSKGIRKHRARIVWNGNPNRLDLPDIALLHIPYQPPAHFPLIAPYRLQPHTPIFTAGYGGISLGKPNMSHSTGHIQHLHTQHKLTYRTRWIEFQHNAPLLQGDSGGPIINQSGQLLGIASSIEFTLRKLLHHTYLHSYTSTAICPDPTWIHELIQIDQAKLQQRKF